MKPQRHFTLDDYFDFEVSSPTKHEYLNGEIFAIAGASLAHNHIAANTLAILRTKLDGSHCAAFGSDLRVRTGDGLLTYPDVSVVCGKVALLPDRPDTVTNPVLIVEVLSPATKDYDRNDKFHQYMSIPDFREYLLVEQERILVEHFIHPVNFIAESEHHWDKRTYSRPSDTIQLRFIPVILSVAALYRGVFS